jgi:tetratricopeptide (TPR) repeat protein
MTPTSPAGEASPGGPRKPPETAATLHERALAESERGRHASARRQLRRALRADPEPQRRAHILISLAFHEDDKHGLERGIALLAEADAVPGLPGWLRGLAAGQRALLYLRAARLGEAMANFDAALRLLDDSRQEDVCRVLLNRSTAGISLGRIAGAKDDVTRCAALARAGGLSVMAA